MIRQLTGVHKRSGNVVALVSVGSSNSVDAWAINSLFSILRGSPFFDAGARTFLNSIFGNIRLADLG